MTAAFLKIRFNQFSRGMSGLGLFRSIFLLALFGFAGFAVFILTSELPNAYYVVGGTALVMGTIQMTRQDKLFLKSHFNNYKWLFMVDYGLIALPISIFLIIHYQWVPLFLLLVLTGVVAQLDYKPKQRSMNSLLQRLIPASCFEWKAGIRRSLFFIVPLWLIGLGTSFYIGSVPILIFILGILPISYYEKGEPFQMIVVFEKSANQFLWHKIKMQWLLFSALTLPLMAAFMIFHIQYWHIPLIEYLVFISLHSYLILTKYAFYEPNSKSPAASIFGSIGATASIIAIFLPVVWLLSIRFYFKSRENLNYYLNDYN